VSHSVGAEYVVFVGVVACLRSGPRCVCVHTCVCITQTHTHTHTHIHTNTHTPYESDSDVLCLIHVRASVADSDSLSLPLPLSDVCFDSGGVLEKQKQKGNVNSACTVSPQNIFSLEIAIVHIDFNLRARETERERERERERKIERQEVKAGGKGNSRDLSAPQYSP
jgi:hypothetical protein